MDQQAVAIRNEQVTGSKPRSSLSSNPVMLPEELDKPTIDLDRTSLGLEKLTRRVAKNWSLHDQVESSFLERELHHGRAKSIRYIASGPGVRSKSVEESRSIPLGCATAEAQGFESPQLHRGRGRV